MAVCLPCSALPLFPSHTSPILPSLISLFSPTQSAFSSISLGLPPLSHFHYLLPYTLMTSWIFLELTTLSFLIYILRPLIQVNIPTCEKHLKEQEIQGSKHPNLLMPAVPEAEILLELSPHTCCIHNSLCAGKNLCLRMGCGT